MRKCLTPSPKDSIACIACCNQYVAVPSWSQSLHVYNHTTGQQLFEVQLGQQPLCVAMDEINIYLGCADAVLYRINISAPPKQLSEQNVVRKFQGPIRNIHLIKIQDQQYIVLTTLSCELAIVNIKNNNLEFQTVLPQRVFCSSVSNNKILLCLASRTIITGQIVVNQQNQQLKIDLNKPTESPLRHQTRSCLIIGDKDNDFAYALGSAEGRVAVESKDQFAFRAHKAQNNDEVTSYPVHGLAKYKNFLITAGQDGFVYFWDVQQRKKVYKVQENYCVSHVLVHGDFLIVCKSYCWEERQQGQKSEEIDVAIYNIKDFGL